MDKDELAAIKMELKCWESMFARKYKRKPTKVKLRDNMILYSPEVIVNGVYYSPIQSTALEISYHLLVFLSLKWEFYVPLCVIPDLFRMYCKNLTPCQKVYSNFSFFSSRKILIKVHQKYKVCMIIIIFFFVIMVILILQQQTSWYEIKNKCNRTLS